MDPADLRMLVSQVTQLLESERCVEAHALCRRACVTDPENPLLWRLLGKVGGHCRRYREAEESLNRALAIAPSDPRSWYLLGGVLQMQRRFPAAVEAYRKMLQLRPDHREAGEALGYVLQVVGDLEGAAVAYYESLLGLDPDHGPVLYNLGLICATLDVCAGRWKHHSGQCGAGAARVDRRHGGNGLDGPIRFRVLYRLVQVRSLRQSWKVRRVDPQR